MKCKMRKVLKEWQWVLLTLFVICTYSCKDDDNTKDSPFDPSKPVVVSDFTPKEGGAYQKLLIYGENFGTDISNVKVTIGGKKAVVINVESTHIYCFVPSGAFSGEIEVSVGEGENVVTTTASTKFDYQKKMVVGTLCGYRNNRDDQGWRDGPFDGPEGVKCCGFSKTGRLAIDPLNPNHIYICYDGHKGIQLIDLEKRWLSTPLNITIVPTDRIRSITFNKKIEGYADEAEYMIIAIDYDTGNESPSVYIIQRNADGTFDDNSDIQLLASYKQCNGATVHPINGELYFNSYEKGQVFRLDLTDYFKAVKNHQSWDPKVKDHPDIFKQLFTIADPSWEFQIFIHPTGKYAYYGVINNHYFMRSDYDENKKEFITPYNFVGHYKVSGYKDDVGTEAYMNNPCQGVFIYNKEYEGRDDEYDFYFVDRLNFCVRKITPEGIVSTYAGRGTSTSLADGNHWGTDDGDLREVARFRDVAGLAYDDKNEIFYIQDEVGHTIRTISMEKEEITEGESTEESNE